MQLLGVDSNTMPALNKWLIFVVAWLMATVFYTILPTHMLRTDEQCLTAQRDVPRRELCQPIYDSMIKKNRKPNQQRPPWFDLMNETAEGNWNEAQRVFYLTASCDGRLGNQMYVYASLFGIAWRNPRRIPLWSSDAHGLRKLFNLRISADYNGVSKLVHFTTIDVGDKYEKYFDETEKLRPENIHINSYLQQRRYFAHVEDQLRTDFTFQPHILAEAQRVLDTANATIPPSWKVNGFVRVFIHVRRTDTLTYTFWMLQNSEYTNFFVKSMAYFTDCLPRVQFIVVSDDFAWCHQNIVGEHVEFLDGDRPREVDMAVASLCDHAIITVGSFGWWSAWLADGVTLMMNHTWTP